MKKTRAENIRGLLYILIRNLYIDREPYTIEKKPNLVRLAERNLKSAAEDYEKPRLTQKEFQIHGEVYEKMFLYHEDNDFDGGFQTDHDMNAFIQDFKNELLNYL